MSFSESLKKYIDPTIDRELAFANVGGGVISVYHRGKEVYFRAFGETKLGSRTAPDRKTLFRLASMTKPITAVAALILIDRGLLSVDDRLDKFFPSYSSLKIAKVENERVVTLGRAKKHVTVKHLLTHTSGIGTWDINTAMHRLAPSYSIHTLTDFVNIYSCLPLAFEPGTREAYSPTAGLNLVGAVVEKIADMPFSEFLKKEILTPLGMTDTTFDPNPEQLSRMIYMHDKYRGRSCNGSAPDFIFENVPVTQECGGAGLASTLDDYTAFAEMLRGGGTYKDTRILSRDAVREMSKPQLPHEIMPGPQVWGYAVRVITDESYPNLPVGAYGWSGAYGSHFWIDPVNKISAVYMRNSRYDGGAGSHAAGLLEADVMSAIRESLQ